MTPWTIWDDIKQWLFYRPIYRPWMKLAHRFNWHHMTVCHVEGDVMDWCQWCGIRQIRSNWQEPN